MGTWVGDPMRVQVVSKSQEAEVPPSGRSGVAELEGEVIVEQANGRSEFPGARDMLEVTQPRTRRREMVGLTVWRSEKREDKGSSVRGLGFRTTVRRMEIGIKLVLVT